MSGAGLTLSGVWRRFPSGAEEVAVLKDVSLSIRAGEMVAIIGASGSGKSTLMNILVAWTSPRPVITRWAGAMLANWTATSWPRCGASTSASSSSVITCCRI